MPDGRHLLEQAARPDAAEVDRYRLDLAMVARLRLAALRITAVSGGDRCTVADDGFFSYRRDGVPGRQATLAWLR